MFVMRVAILSQSLKHGKVQVWLCHALQMSSKRLPPPHQFF